MQVWYKAGGFSRGEANLEVEVVGEQHEDLRGADVHFRIC
jgi:hypothetical protein